MLKSAGLIAAAALVAGAVPALGQGIGTDAALDCGVGHAFVGGAIEQDADTVTLLHRPCEKEDRGEWDPDMLELYLDKNRRGPTGMVRMAYFPNTGRIVK